MAQRVLDAASRRRADAQRRVAWTVIAHTSFDKRAFGAAEKAYAEVLKLTPEKDPARNDLVERQAAAIYKQGERRARAAASARSRGALRARRHGRAAVDACAPTRSTTPPRR